MLVYRRFRNRVYPTPEQITKILSWRGPLRWLWNIALEQRLMAYGRSKCDRKYPSFREQNAELTELRAMLPWLEEVPRHLSMQILIELDNAWNLCFLGVFGAPQYKSKNRSHVPMIEGDYQQFRIEKDAIKFPKLGEVKAVIHRPILGVPCRCILKPDGDQWFITIESQVEIDDPTINTKPVAAIDRGVVNLIADSDGRVVQNPKHADRMQRRVVRVQRSVARKKKGSNNQKKARVKLVRLQRHVRRQRYHALHLESHYYAKNHSVVIMEDLDLCNMTASAAGTVDRPGKNVAAKSGLNRSIMNSGWGILEGMIKYKVVQYGGELIYVNPAYSSQTCAECGSVDKENRKTQSEFECVACGHHDNADKNAARVLLGRGMKELDSRRSDGDADCGGSATGRPVKQQPRAVKRETRKRKYVPRGKKVTPR